jgi:hypothetical protein
MLSLLSLLVQKVQILTRACKAALPLDLYARLLFTASVTRAGAYHFTCYTGTKVQIPMLLFRHRRRGVRLWLLHLRP